ncbi:toll/interleukin-1 receptor domain-containing protein [Dongia sedimenti]|uniref:Toll/interleukin-1 receptor domain-containing protein n=1 Tax=Dongia sedimenti TaxID=3064282 RepID=A0ABU0YVP4_9PROT|nr:toll/interleukin-1 receptor domain-containing protein [Rhodospirillaceae bacterium R-7]
MDKIRIVPIPVVYVLWHPRCALGEVLAKRILRWLRPGNGLGPQVFYRSLPAPDAPDDGLPPPLPGESRPGKYAESAMAKAANLQVVVPLIDDNMVADPVWRHWLVALATNRERVSRHILPTALDPTAYNMPSPVSDQNYLRPAGLPLPNPSAIAEADPGFALVERSLLKQLTEAMCRLLLGYSRRAASEVAAGASALDGEAAPLKVKVFLSHAKADGAAPASRLRDYINGKTQLDAFYDENDIAFGSSFGGVIQRAVQSSETAAMIAVRTTKYSSRPWCRRELSMFRRPICVNAGESGTAQRWRLYPLLVVEAMEGMELSAGIPEFGNSQVVRWTDQVPDIDEFIVTTVIRNAMLASFHAALGASLQAGPDQIVINWLPDAATLLQIPAVRQQRKVEVLHPGRRLSYLEATTMDEMFPTLTFTPFERAPAP